MKKIAVVLSGLFLVTACSGGADVTENEVVMEESGDLKVVTTIAPLYSLTANLIEGVDGVELSNIVPPNTSVHSFAMTPQIAKEISDADLIVQNGVELELFLEGSLKDSGAMVVDSSEGVDLRKLEHEESGHEGHEHEDEHEHDDHGHEGHEHEDEHEHEGHGHNHGEFDPHIWLSPVNAKMQARNITEGLIAVDSENEDAYRANLNSLETELNSLQDEMSAGFNSFEVGSYVVFHDAYHYFEESFGIEAAAFLEEFGGKEPTAEYLAGVIEIVESNGVEVIFTEPQFSPKLVQTLVDDYGLRTFELDPLGQEISKESYFKMMRGNLAAFEEAFKK